jgi:hypothetical protein
VWLLYTGFGGLFLLFLREIQAIVTAVKVSIKSPFVLKISQAWAVIFFQNILYGTWMTPLYFVTMGLVFATSYRCISKIGNAEE